MDNEREGSSRQPRDNSKWHKELENTALQTSLSSLQRTGDGREEEMVVERDDETGEETGPVAQQEEEEDEVLPLHQLQAEERERTLTDHLNKRLLSSFLEQLNQAEFQLPPAVQNIQRSGDGGQASEDSNRMQEDW